MKKIGLFFWPTKGNVEKVANAIKARFEDSEIEVVSLDKITPQHLFWFDNLILGSSTVGADHWEDATDDNKWYQLFHQMELDKVDLNGKNIALYGLGDQIKYPYNFVDGLERVHSALINHNVNFIGEYPNKGFEFYESKALHDGYFRGLAIDLDNEENHMNERIDEWIGMIKPLLK
jgi:flavodoxin I